MYAGENICTIRIIYYNYIKDSFLPISLNVALFNFVFITKYCRDCKCSAFKLQSRLICAIVLLLKSKKTKWKSIYFLALLPLHTIYQNIIYICSEICVVCFFQIPLLPLWIINGLCCWKAVYFFLNQSLWHLGDRPFERRAALADWAGNKELIINLTNPY